MLGEEALSPRDIFTTSCMAILLAAPARASELFYLKADCLEYGKDIRGNKQTGLKWYSGKGYGYEVEWIPDCMWDVVEEAIERLQRLSADGREFAKKIEETNSFPRHPLCPNVEEGELLAKREVVLALGLDTSSYLEKKQVAGEMVTSMAWRPSKAKLQATSYSKSMV